MKFCPVCKIDKPLNEFHNDKRRKDGKAYQCKICKKAAHLKYSRSEAGQKTIKAQHHKYYRSEHGKKYYEKYYNSDARVQSGKKSYEKRIKNGKIAKQRKERYHSDIKYRLKRNLGNRIRKAMNGKDKSIRTRNLLGCSIEYFKQHLESQFTEGMTWDNKDEWHIDHIKPIALFNLLDRKDQKKCFHYTNLQLLWAIDNWEKNSFFI